ncbi:MAG: peptide chain release factor H [Filimonas sp.]|nr:peptide chain release factor H [Filimonas sp.]
MDILLQISAGKGPEECTRVVAKVLELLLQEARDQKIEATVIEKTEGNINGTLLSANVLLKGKQLHAFVNSWQGTVQWIAQSPYRKFHKRKNWFVSIQAHDQSEVIQLDEKDVVYKTCRASGPGGQHVNKTETAVRATHIPSGISVTASDRRSQLQNKKEALERLKAKITSWQMEQALNVMQQKWMQHNLIKRGEAVRTVEASLS